ncbi:MAG: hypothetical protein MUO27_08020 [Sedimentisphaerales bacterium]|nr:hypothetical protein [Sedimentisphaerales bacterium]
MGMDTPDDLIVAYADVIAGHCAWLQQFDKQRLKEWEDLLKNNPEAAICEAETRKLLSDHNVDVQPYEDLSHGGPDFLCAKDNKRFYVEVTCIIQDVATKKTKLPPSPPGKHNAQYYSLLTKHILGELCKKTKQCAGLNLPCVGAIATLHTQAGVLCFKKLACEDILTGTTQITMDINIQKGHAVSDPYQTTNLEDSAFIRFTKKADGTIEYARNPISAVFLCAFGQYPVGIYGLLHPNPNYPFGRALLPDIEFARLADGYHNGVLKVEWI